MAVEALIAVEDYLNTTYSPEKEYRDGVLVERNVGEKAHARLQLKIGAYLNRRRKQWNIEAYTELRIKVRENWYPIPDVCVYSLPDFEERYPTRPPLLWVEILSHDDRIIDVWEKAAELVKNGVPYVWVIDPNTLESEVRTAAGMEPVPDRTLRIPGTPIVSPLADVLEE
jgi:Uma2 family endonuclease